MKNFEHGYKNKYSICLVGGYSFKNYGDEITYYCLYSVLKSLGHNVKMAIWPIRYKRYFKKYSFPGKMWRPNKAPYLFAENPYQEEDIYPVCKSRKELRKLDAECDVFMVGSGQYFNSRVLNNVRYYTLLDWVADDKKKIAYCAAWGNGRYSTDNPHEIEIIGLYIKKFDYFSVRENTAVDTAKKLFTQNAEWVIDPIFLCDKKILDRLADKSDKVVPADFIFSYMLDTSAANGNAIKKYGEMYTKEIISVCSTSMDRKAVTEPGWTLKTETSITIEDWLFYIRKCECMITDSFHGLCLALIFRKPFVLITRPFAGNDRYFSLLQRLDLQRYIIENPENILGNEFKFLKIDYRAVNLKIGEHKETSMKWLMDSLKYEKATSDNNRHEKPFDFSKVSFIDDIKVKIACCYNDLLKIKHSLGAFLHDKSNRQKNNR